MNRRIYVPKNAEEMKKDWLGDESADSYSWELSSWELERLWSCGVFDYFNQMDYCGTVRLNYTGLHEFEDDFICWQQLYLSYDEIVNDLRTFSCTDEVERLIGMIDKSIECGTLLCFTL